MIVNMIVTELDHSLGCIMDKSFVTFSFCKKTFLVSVKKLFSFCKKNFSFFRACVCTIARTNSDTSTKTTTTVVSGTVAQVNDTGKIPASGNGVSI